MNIIRNQIIRNIWMVYNLFIKYKNYSQVVWTKKFTSSYQHFQQSIILSFLFKLLNLNNNNNMLVLRFVFSNYFKKGPKNDSRCNRDIQGMLGTMLRNFKTSITKINHRLLDTFYFIT